MTTHLSKDPWCCLVDQQNIMEIQIAYYYIIIVVIIHKHCFLQLTGSGLSIVEDTNTIDIVITQEEELLS